MEALGYSTAPAQQQAGWSAQCAGEAPIKQSCPTFSRTGSLCSTQSLLSEALQDGVCQASWRGSTLDATQDSFMAEDSEVFLASPAPEADDGSYTCAEDRGPAGFGPTYASCIEMIRQHKFNEAAVVASTRRLADGAGLDDGARMIVVSWMLEVVEEFGLQQETLHAAVTLLDRFLAASQAVPRCVLQLVAVGCMFIAAKALEVHHPSVEQMVGVAAHSFSGADLLRVERILLDALDFCITSPTPYGFLHLLTQATLAAGGADLGGGGGGGPAMERVVSLAMYLTELALLDQRSLAFPGSQLATAALLLAHLTLSRHTRAWPGVLSAAGMAEAELLLPLHAKFGQDCWCRVSQEVQPISLQAVAGGQQQQPQQLACLAQ